MNKFILGSILAAISLMVIYGSSASNRVTSWVDRENSTSTQSNFGPGNNQTNDQFIALNETEQDSITEIGSRTPLEKAGEIPQRQTVQGAPAFGTNVPSNTNNTTNDTDDGILEPNPPGQTTPAQPTPAPAQTQNPPPQTPAQNQPPVRALW